MATNPLIAKLAAFTDLTPVDREWLATISCTTIPVEADTTLIDEGDVPHDVILIMEGFAYRYKTTPEGGRQIFAYLVPGDFCDLHVALLDEMDHSIGTLSACRVVKIPKRTVVDLTDNHPTLAKAFWWCSLVDEATLREWLVNVGQRTSIQRIAHLFCEMHVRLDAVNLTVGGSFELPITQAELGDTVGMSNVHVNRSLKSLRETGLMTFRGRSVRIPDVDKLKHFASFNPNYLHLNRRGSPSQEQAISQAKSV
jgi:CRP-like cAMP-binding protein